MPHRPLFVSRCHHFSPVIYFIAVSVSVSLPPPPPSLHYLSSFTCALSPLSPPLLLLRPLVLSFSCTLSHPPRCAPCLRTPSLETLHHTTQHNSALLTLPETLLYVSVSVSFSLPFPSQSSTELPASFSLSLALPRTGSGISTTIPSARKRQGGGGGAREEREIERGRETGSNKERR